MNNMQYYEAGRSVPKEAQKAFSNGTFSGTDINPMWRIKKLTEMFGPAGIGWYVEVLSERAETYGETVMAIVDINLYIKADGEWSKPIFGTGGNQLVQVTKSGARPSDEGYKKAYTDALSIACKALGIGADIWYSADPDVYDPTSKYASKYVSGSKEAARTVGEQKLKALGGEVEQKPAPNQVEVPMIAPGQQRFLLENMPPEQLKKYQKRYGDELQGMTREQAEAGVAWVQKLQGASA